MLKTLINKQILELFQTYVIDKKTGKLKSKSKVIFSVFVFVFLFFCLGFIFFNISNAFGSITLGQGVNWSYFAIMGLLSIALGVFGSVFNTYASLYLPKDNEQLMAMPIPNHILLLARLVGLYFMSLLYSAWVWIPVIISYWLVTPLNATNIIFPILLTFVIALLVSVLTCILGWVVAIIAKKTKGKAILTVFMTIAFIAIYYVIYFKIINSISEIQNNIGNISLTIKSWLYYIYMLGMAADGDIVNMMLFTVITLIAAIICIFILSKTLLRLTTTENNNSKLNTLSTKYNQTNSNKALLNREYSHFTSVSTWMLNSGVGIIIMVLLAFASLIKMNFLRDKCSLISEQMPLIATSIPIIIFGILCSIISTNAISASSISLEGNNLWIIQSLPINPWDIIRSKEKMHIFTCCIPLFITVLILGFVFQINIFTIALILIATTLYTCFIADFGLYLNIKYPNLHWTNVTVPVKQSLPVTIICLGGIIISLVFTTIGIFISSYVSSEIILLIISVVFTIAYFLLNKWLKNTGSKIISTL